MLEDKLLELFQAFIQQDTELRSMIIDASNTEICINEGKLIFTLRGLYHITSMADTHSYEQFRAELYRSHLNERLRQLGYQVFIFQSTAKVDSSWYQLEALLFPS